MVSILPSGARKLRTEREDIMSAIQDVINTPATETDITAYTAIGAEQAADKEAERTEHEAELRRVGAQAFAENLGHHIRNHWEMFSNWGCFEEDLQTRYEYKGARETLQSLRRSLERTLVDAGTGELQAGLLDAIETVDVYLAELKPKPTISERFRAMDEHRKTKGGAQ
jgi:hypothetical protein